MWILTVVFDLRGPRKPIAKGKNWLPRTAQVPAMNITIYSTGSKHICVVCREVDVRDSPGMSVKSMFDGSLCGIILHIQIPYQCLLVCRADNPIIPCSEWRPLYICHKPWKAMPKVTRGVQGGIKIDNIESISATMISSVKFQG